MKLIDQLVNDIHDLVSFNNSNKKIFLHEPSFESTNANLYLSDCINTGWVSTAGSWVDKFENKLCEITNSKYAIAITNGTDALRLSFEL